MSGPQNHVKNVRLSEKEGEREDKKKSKSSSYIRHETKCIYKEM